MRSPLRLYRSAPALRPCSSPTPAMAGSWQGTRGLLRATDVARLCDTRRKGVAGACGLRLGSEACQLKGAPTVVGRGRGRSGSSHTRPFPAHGGRPRWWRRGDGRSADRSAACRRRRAAPTGSGPGGIPARASGHGGHPTCPGRRGPPRQRHARWPVSHPGRGRTKTGRMGAGSGRTALGWTWGPAATYLYSPNRKSEQARTLLEGCRRFLHATGTPDSTVKS
jgi:hypothetical protein